jgi:hypothetical protein
VHPSRRLQRAESKACIPRAACSGRTANRSVAQRARHMSGAASSSPERQHSASPLSTTSPTQPQQEHITDPAKLREVKRVLYGFNQGAPVPALALPKEAAAAAGAASRPFDLQAYAFSAAPEELRPARVVRVGLVQNAVVAPTDAPFAEQRQVRGRRMGGG